MFSENALRAAIADFVQEENLPRAASDALARECRAVLDLYRARRREVQTPLILGICGSQGSGKTTLAHALGRILQASGVRTARLSLDDFYLPGSAREALAREVHPLLRTRGVPGTHDVARGLDVFDRLTHAASQDVTPLPAFDKARDEPVPEEDELRFTGRADVILFEGWCVGAAPQAAAELTQPINPLERDEDPEGAWRTYVNRQLSGPYQDWFAKLDLLILLQAPSFETVLDWRRQQEDRLRDQVREAGRPTAGLKIMDEVQLRAFVSHYERLTRHILTEMPARADLAIALNAARDVQRIERKPTP